MKFCIVQSNSVNTDSELKRGRGGRISGLSVLSGVNVKGFLSPGAKQTVRIKRVSVKRGLSVLLIS